MCNMGCIAGLDLLRLNHQTMAVLMFRPVIADKVTADKIIATRPIMQPIEVLDRLASATSRAAKEQIIREAYVAGCFEFFEAVQLATDPFMPFGLTRAAKFTETDDHDGSGYSFSF